jgi:hypothetical protein
MLMYNRQQANEMTDEQRINDDHSPKTFPESDHEDIQIKSRTKRTSTKQPKPSLKRAHSSPPHREEPVAQQAQSPAHETPKKAKTRAERKAEDTFEEETPIPQAPRKERRTARYVRIDDVRMNLARKFKEGI